MKFGVALHAMLLVSYAVYGLERDLTYWTPTNLIIDIGGIFNGKNSGKILVITQRSKQEIVKKKPRYPIRNVAN